MRSLLILIFLSFSFATLTFQVEEGFNQLTKTIKGSPRIEGSGTQTAPPDMFPFMAILRKKDNWQPLFCSGTIIDVHHILTAASCLLYMNESQILVTVGTNRYNSGGTNYTVSKITKHPEFDIPVNSTLNDIAILRINGSITFGPHVKAVDILLGSLSHMITFTCSPTNIKNPIPNLPIDFPASVIPGWGNLSSAELQYIQLPILKYTECLRVLNKLPLKNFNVYAPNQLCAYKNRGQSGFCLEDRGGPLMSGKFQIGIASWGGPCMAGLPNVFTFVICYQRWIDEAIKI